MEQSKRPTRLTPEQQKVKNPEGLLLEAILEDREQGR